MKGPVAIAATAGAVGLVMAAAPARAQENKFDLSLALVETYDTNILRLGEQRTNQPTDNLSTAPRLTLDYSRQLARQRIFANGYAGYVWNNRFDFLNRQDIALTGGADIRVGPKCRATVLGTFVQAQSDLEDLGVVISNVATTTDYSIAASCPRPSGFYPIASAGYFKVDNERRQLRNQNIVDGRVGIGYSLPSLGTAQLFGAFSTIRRARVFDTPEGPVRDVTQIRSAGLRVGRDVGTRIKASGEVGYTSADPASPQATPFSGITYSINASYTPISRFVLSAAFGRSVSARGNLGVSYILRDQVDFGARLTVSRRTSFGASVQLSQRDYKGEDPLFVAEPRLSDTQLNAQADVRYRLAQPITLELAARYRQRTAENDFYDYDSFATTLRAMLSI
ncbi:outer membrane beta-barrel protein [Sphingomonas sp. Leaf62]|uniref:outer membrane beta-barrel protein n=1 Tax=Sphingomonas sp. Leaf62 TaxID=1736228 RepID=UPI00070161F9|nr:outer membrane beta-barrel protein [Sphingomonas sp. Leaf62]KQN76183.1 hypothetical protein ASE91_16280 [Sphingomonas sp. Leaf62]